MMPQTKRRPRGGLSLMPPPPRYPHFTPLSLVHLMLRAGEAHRCKAHRAHDERHHVSDDSNGAASPGGAATLTISASVALLSLLLQQVPGVLGVVTSNLCKIAHTSMWGCQL